jgi:tetratricopeptide (TPR) repeat protein
MPTTGETSDKQWISPRDEGVRFLEEGNYEGAVKALSGAILGDPSGESHALLGLAHFQLEEYASAATNYEAAIERGPDNHDWREMLAVAKANSIAEVHVPVPDIYFFDRAKLLAKAEVPEGALPSPPPPAPAPGLRKRVQLALGNVIGAIASFKMQVLTQLVGKLLGYRDQMWTNWYRRPFVLAILTLAYMREQLNKHNLKTTYPRGALIGFQPEGQAPPQGVTHFRTADGSWNNLSDPKEGAAGTRFPRNVENEAIRPETGETLLAPNPREVSRVLLTREREMKEVSFLNLLAAAWINFQNHDWIHHGESLTKDVHEIPLTENDPARKRYWQTKMFVGKTQPDPTRTPGNEEPPITFINEVTHWWDGSQIYGSDQETVDRLRSGVDGKLRLTGKGTLPLDKNSIEETGFTRNWWVGLAMFHTLFVREHDAICNRLKEAHPDWDDQRLFNVARLINAAVMAKIHSVEWTPAILPNRALDAGLNANWYGLLTNLFRTGKDRKTVAEINARNPEMGGVVGNPIDKHGQPFGLTEEFVEVYRLHSLLPESIQLRRISEGDKIEEIPFVETRQAGSAKLTQRAGMADLIYSFGKQHPGQLVLNNFPRFMQELSIPGNPLFDMGAVDILRARERGVPRYNQFRRQLGLNPIRSFGDLTDNKEHVRKLTEVYGNRPEDVEKLDLMIGTLAEGHRPTGFGFGETLFQIFILNATRRLQADRFYTDSYNEETYTKEGLKWIDDSDLKTVLLRHYPELARTGLANIKNAFEPWDTEERLKPERHPLRAFDRELKPDPWLGDASKTGR